MSPNISWRFKIYLCLVLLFLSIYMLLPSVLGLKELREEAAAQQKPLPAYAKLFPTKHLNLGLDLRGGIYLELEVGIREVLKNRLDFDVRTLRDVLTKDGVLFSEISTTREGDRIRAVMNDEKGMASLKQKMNDSFQDALETDSKFTELVFTHAATDAAFLGEELRKIKNLIEKQPGFLALERSNQTFRILLSDASKKEQIAGLIKNAGGLEPKDEPHKVFFQFSEELKKALQKEAIDKTIEKIRSRIDKYGVSEPAIRSLDDDRIAIELPGVKNPDAALEVVKSSGKLEFRLADESKNPAELEMLISEIRAQNQIPEGFSKEVVLRINEAAQGKIPEDSEILFKLEKDSGSEKLTRGIPYLLKKKVELTGDFLTSAKAEIIPYKSPYVSIQFNAEGADLFGKLTTANVHKPIVTVLDAEIMSIATINEPITTGGAQITFNPSTRADDIQQIEQEARTLALVLTEGSLPASLKEVTKTVVGPSLGQETIHRGLMAAALAALVVMVFMVFYYKFSGVLANLALVFNVLLIVGVLAMFEATLTLPGIAGIVLTMGMALDASIIIFERIREELKLGQNIRQAVNAGFKNAWSAVMDTHLTTFLSGFVLYQFGTGPVRGFAVTLMVGVLTTFFTAYWVNHLMYEYLLNRKKWQKLSI